MGADQFFITLGLSVDEFLSNWRREAETVLGARKAGQLDIEVYKVIAERKVRTTSK